MADNVITDAGSGGASFVTREIVHAGDTSQLSGSFIMGISGSEGSYTAAAINGDATNGLDVDVTRVIPGVSATHLGKAEDAAHSTGDTGVAILGVRRDTAAVGSGADGDYSTLNLDASGRLWSHDPVAVALLTTIDVDTGSMSTDLGTIAGAVASGQMQVDIVADGAGLATAANQLADGHNVTVDNASLAVTIAAGAAAIGKAEDVASAAADVGVPAMARRTATPADTSGADLDYEMLQMDNGRLWVSATIDAALPAGTNEIGKLAAGTAEIGNIKNSGTFVVQVDGDALTALQLIDDIVYTDDTSTHATGTSKGALMMAAATPTDAAVDANDIGSLAMSLDRRLLVDAQIVGTDSALDVSGATVTVDNGGIFAVQVDGDALTALQLIDDAIFADDAAFTLTSSKVMAAGGIRDDTLSALAAVEGDVVPFRVNANGALHVTGSSGSTQYAEDAAHSTGDTGTMGLFVRNDTLGALTDTDGDYSPGQVNASGALYVEAALSATDNAVLDDIAADGKPKTSGGISTVYRDEDIDETAVALKASAGQIYWVHVINLDATPVYLHFYDVAQGSVTVGTTGELCSFAVPSQGDANGAGFTMPFPHGIEFGTAITVACTTTISGTAGPGTNEVILNVGYE